MVFLLSAVGFMTDCFQFPLDKSVTDVVFLPAVRNGISFRV